jgi:hypothetical protein
MSEGVVERCEERVDLDYQLSDEPCPIVISAVPDEPDPGTRSLAWDLELELKGHIGRREEHETYFSIRQIPDITLRRFTGRLACKPSFDAHRKPTLGRPSSGPRSMHRHLLRGAKSKETILRDNVLRS